MLIAFQMNQEGVL